MNTRLLALSGLAAASLLAGGAFLAYAEPPAGATMKPQTAAAGKEEKDDDEVEIKLAEAPEAIRAAVAKIAPVDSVKKVTRESDDGVTTFEVEYMVNGSEASATFAASGEIMEMEKSVKTDALPALALDAVKKKFPGATMKSANSVQKMYYEVNVVIDGKSHEVKVDANGEISKGK